MPTATATRTCTVCNRDFAPSSSNRFLCSARCQQERHNQRRRAEGQYAAAGIAPGVYGRRVPADGEYAVIYELESEYCGPLPQVHGQYATEAEGRAVAGELARCGFQAVRLERWAAGGRATGYDRGTETLVALYGRTSGGQAVEVIPVALGSEIPARPEKEKALNSGSDGR